MKWYVVSLLLLQILTASGIFIVFKVVGVRKINSFQTLVVNYIFAVVFSLFKIDWAVGLVPDEGVLTDFWPAVIIGFLFMFNFLLMMQSTKRAGAGLTSAFSKMSVLIPVVVGIFFLHQTNNIIYKVLGILLTLVSFYLILYNDNNGRSADKKRIVKGLLLPFGVFFFSGLNDVLQELSRKYLIDTTNDAQLFLFITFLAALLFSLIFAISDMVKNGSKISWEAIACGAALGLCNYFTSKLLLSNIYIFGGSIVFPIVNASTVLLTTMLGILLFKEKLTRKQWIGVGVAALAVAFIAVAI